MVDVNMFQNKQVPPLTEEQEKSPYAPLYYKPISDPSPEILKSLNGGQLEADKALLLSDMEQAFKPDSMPTDNGWCVLPDGTGYSTVRVYMPEVTPEIEKWWYGWFKNPVLDYLHYKIWMPGWHVSHAEPLIEDVGWGNLKIYTGGFFDEKILGLSDEADKLDPDFLHAVVSSGVSISENDPHENKIYNTIVKIYKKYGKGIQVQAFNYLGVGMMDSNFAKMHSADPEKVLMFALHNAYECSRMGEILPELYRIGTSL